MNSSTLFDIVVSENFVFSGCKRILLIIHNRIISYYRIPLFFQFFFIDKHYFLIDNNYSALILVNNYGVGTKNNQSPLRLI